MDELALNVEELDFSLRENSTGIRGPQNKTRLRKSIDSGSKSKEYHLNPLNQTTSERQIASKYCTLPSISPKEKPMVDLCLIGCDNRQNEACGAFQSAHNRSSLEDLTYDKQPGPTQGSLGLKSPGKSLLAPLVERKTHSRDNVRQRSTTNPELPTSLLRHKNQYEDLQAHQILYTGADGDHETQLRAQCCSNESITKSKETCRMIKSSKKLLDVPASTGRRFSAPLSPRFVRRLIPERIYSSCELQNDDHDPEAEARLLTPDRESIFSPPYKEFDRLQVDEKQRDVEKDHSKTQRKTIEVDLRIDSTRYLNEIKVSLPDQNDKHLRKGRAKSMDKRKNSYTLSASSETLWSGDILPPVKTAMPECQARNRAFSASGLMALGRNDVTNKPFDSPMFLDVEAQRLSHLSLSPRLPRKF